MIFKTIIIFWLSFLTLLQVALLDKFDKENKPKK